MKKLSIAPRPPINQGVDTNNQMVQQHTSIYNSMISQIGPVGATFYLNPYGTAPLSGVLAVFLTNLEQVRVQISDNINSIPVEYYFTPQFSGPTLIPIIGFAPAATNTLNVTGTGMLPYTNDSIATVSLPLTDADLQGRQYGFPEIEGTINKNPPSEISELYFTAYSLRYNVGTDCTGRVRWYTTKDMLTFNIQRLVSGNFVATLGEKVIQEFDLVGRMHKVYILDNFSHHNIFQLPDGSLMFPSENDGVSKEDGISIIDIDTGLETSYYDIRQVLDMNRMPRIPDDSQVPLDWLHINQSVLDETNNLIVSSARHQSVIFGIDFTTSELVFIAANQQDWADDYKPYFLTPVDENGTPLYDLTDPDDIDKADKEFWTWGQHAVVIQNSSNSVIDYYLLDNGNFRSRDYTKALIPNDNYSRLAAFRVNIALKTIMKLYEYGKVEVGNRGYSSFVSNAQLLSNGNFFIHFGGGITDDTGRRRSVNPLTGSDIPDPALNDTAQAYILQQEVDITTGEVFVEQVARSGSYKNPTDEGPSFASDMWSFRAYKLPIMH